MSKDTLLTHAQRRAVRVLHVVQTLGLAGTEYGVIKIANKMDQDRVASSICCLTHRSDETLSLLSNAVTVHELHKQPGLDMGVAIRLSELIRANDIDVIHSRNWPTFLYSALAARLCGIPLVHGEHGRESTATNSRRLQASRWLVKLVDRVIAVNEDIARDLVHHWRLPPERIRVIPNGVDLEAFEPDQDRLLRRKEFGWGENELVLLNVGGLRPVKDHPTLLRAFRRVLRQAPNARLLIVGTDWGSGERERLERLAAGLHIERETHFAGIRYDVPRLQALCDVYVNSSLFEGMSNTILEAMAASKPVVASSVGGNRDLVQHGTTGLLYEAGDEAALAIQLQTVLGDESLRHKFGAAGRQVVERHHSMAEMLEAYTETYREVHWRRSLRRSSGAKDRIKQAAARGVAWSGARQASRKLRPGQLTVLTYHRILPLRQAVDYAFQGMVMARDVFEGQIAHLAREHEVVPLSQAVEMLRVGELDRRVVAITFDDGYRDNYEQATPILTKHRVPATFFLTTGAIDGTVRLWWDVVALAVERLQLDRELEEVAAAVPEEFASALRSLRDGNTSQRVAQSLVTLLNSSNPETRRQVIDTLEGVSDVARDEPDLMLSWDQVREMQAAGMEFGSHTVTHAFIDELDPTSARWEIGQSLARLSEVLGRPARGFAFPRGRSDESARKWLIDANVEYAVTTERGSNQPGADPMRLKRIDAGWGCLDRGFDPVYFEAELGNWFEWARRTG